MSSGWPSGEVEHEERQATEEEHRRLRVELDACRAELRSEARQRAALVAGISQELRHPLHGIASMTELLVNSDLPVHKAQVAESILRRVAALRHALDNLLAAQQLDLGGLTLLDDQVDVLEVLEEVIAEARRGALLPGVQLGAELAPGGRRMICTDRHRLRQVLVQLVSNACKHTRFGVITVTVRSVEDRMRIDVRDTGSGIAPGDLERIFDPYERGRTDGAADGVGLGLSLARRLTEAMGGTIGVTSTPALGSVFWVELPSRGRGVEPASGPDGRLRAMVVEDDEVNRIVVGRQLERLGVSAVSVPDGESALVRLEVEHFDLLLLDVRLPGISGLEVARRVRRAPVRPLVVAVSGASTAADRAACFEAGMDTFIAKPTTLEALGSVLEAARQRQRQC